MITVHLNTLKLEKAMKAASLTAAVASGVVVRTTAANILHDFQMEAPVKTGRFRAGWSVYLIETGLHALVEGPKAKEVAEGRLLGSFIDKTQSPTRPSIAIRNGVTYGPDLEGGKSIQADEGFHQRIIERHAAALE